MDSFCSFFVHVRLRSFRSMTSFFCPMSGSGLSDLWSVRISVRLFCVPFKGKKIRWPSLSFFRSCPVFRIYDLPPPWTVYSDHSCPPVSHHLVLFPFEFRFVCFVSRLHVLCPVFGFPSRCNLFSICCLARLLSFCPGYVFRPVFYSTNATFFVELVPKQSSRHSVSTISSALFCSLSWHSFYSTYY